MSFGQLTPKLSKLIAGVVGVGSAVTAYNYQRPKVDKNRPIDVDTPLPSAVSTDNKSQCDDRQRSTDNTTSFGSGDDDYWQRYANNNKAFLSTRQWDYWQRSTDITTYSHTDDGPTKSTIPNSYTNSVSRDRIVAGVVGGATAVMVYGWYLPTGPGLGKIVTGVVGAGAAIVFYDYFIYPRSDDGQTKSTNNGD